MSAKSACWLSKPSLFSEEKIKENVLFQSDSAHPKRLILAFHGYGSDAYDLSSLAKELKFKDTLWAFVQAPFETQNNDKQREWYSPFKSPNVPRTASFDLIKKITSQLSELTQISFEKIFYLGFSQGGSMALYAGLMNENPLGGILVLSGYLIKPIEILKHIRDKKVTTPILCVHGSFDTVVYPFMFHDTVQSLKEDMGLKVKSFEYPIGHHVSYDTLERIKEFIEEHS